MKRILFILSIILVGGMFLVSTSRGAMTWRVGDEGEISFGGYLENLTGYKIGQEQAGRNCSFRNTLLPEFLFTFNRDAKLFVSGRFAKEIGYEMEDNIRADMGLSPLSDDYYDETEFEPWELYLDLTLAGRSHLRVGKQFIIWGETDVFRLLDVINPQDSSWAPPALMPLEETRLPVYAMRFIYDFSPFTNLEFVFVPMIDEDENLTDKGAPTGGRWAIHPEERVTSQPQLYPAMGPDIGALMGQFGPGTVIPNVTVMRPESDLDQSRVGVRFTTVVKRVTLSFADYYGHNLGPPVIHYHGTTREVRHELVEGPFGNAYYDDVNYYRPNLSVRWKRQNVLGMAMNYFDDRWTDCVFRGEVAYRHDKPYATFGEEKGAVKMDTISYCFGIDRDFFFPLIHPDDPNRTIFASFQIFQDIILGNEDDLHITGYLTDLDKVTTNFTFKINTGYCRDVYNPELIIAYDPKGNGMVCPSFTYKPPWSERYYLETRYINYFGSHSYNGLGFFREKDAVFFRLRYMW